MSLTFDELEPDYVQRLANAKILKVSQAEAIAKKLLLHRDRFLAVQQETGVPALWLMPVFEREGPSFDCYLGNGDPLDRKTVDVPHDRGPFSTWEAGCSDALHLDHVSEVPPGSWKWPMACYEWERWNGFGPREHGRPTGYLWSGTDQYRGGKYVADGVWSPRTWDGQLGTVIVAKAIAGLDAEIAQGFTR